MDQFGIQRDLVNLAWTWISGNFLAWFCKKPAWKRDVKPPLEDTYYGRFGIDHSSNYWVLTTSRRCLRYPSCVLCPVFCILYLPMSFQIAIRGNKIYLSKGTSAISIWQPIYLTIFVLQKYMKGKKKNPHSDYLNLNKPFQLLLPRAMKEYMLHYGCLFGAKIKGRIMYMQS